jgi:hypothetical protein
MEPSHVIKNTGGSMEILDFMVILSNALSCYIYGVLLHYLESEYVSHRFDYVNLDYDVTVQTYTQESPQSYCLLCFLDYLTNSEVSETGRRIIEMDSIFHGQV